MAEGIQKAEYNDPTPNNFPDDYDRNDVDSRVLIRTNAVLHKEFGSQTRAAMAQAEEITSVVAGEAKSEAGHATQTANDLQQRYQDQIEGQVEPSEVVDARRPVGANAYPTLNQRLQAGVDDRSKNVKAFGVKGDGVTDDLAAINKVIADANDGDTLFFPAGNYKISNNIVINKKINIVGAKPTYSDGDLVRGTVIRGGGGIYFKTGSASSTVNGIGVVVATGFTNGFDIHGTISDIKISDCLTIAQSHGYLIESYDGLVDNTKVIDCEAHDSIHGFISKATRTTFDSCLANNISSWGFGVISDNIEGVDHIGAAIDNKITNCTAINAVAGFIQYRRNYYEDNADAVPCVGNQFIGNTANACRTSLQIGDTPGDTSSGKYTPYAVESTIINGFTESEPVGTSKINFSTNLNVNAIHLAKDLEMDNDDTHINDGLSVGLVSGAKFGSWFNIQRLESSATPSLGFGRSFRSDNSEPTSITEFKDIRAGEEYTVTLWDDMTQIVGGSNIWLFNGPVYGRGNSVTLRAQDGIVFETNRSSIGYQAKSIAYTAATGFDPGLCDFVDIAARSTDDLSNLIKINNPASRSPIITILIRSAKDSIKPAGFDKTQFSIPSDDADLNFTNALPWGTGLMTQWAYLPATSKYVLISKQKIKY